MELKFEAIEAKKEELVQDPFIQGFFDKLDELREQGVDGFQTRLEDLLGKMLSAAKPHQKHVFFEVLLQSISATQWNNFFTEFFENQANGQFLQKSTYRQRAEAILNKWNLPIRFGFNFPGWIDVKTQRVQHLEMLSESLETPAFVLQGKPPVNIYEDGSVKKVVDLIVATGMRQIFGWNGFLDDLKLLQKDLENDVVKLHLNVFFNSHAPQSLLVKALVLLNNKLETKINEIEESNAAHSLDQLTQIYDLQARVELLQKKIEQLQGSEILKDKYQSQVVPRLNRQNSQLNRRNAELGQSEAEAQRELEELRAQNYALKAELNNERRARMAAEQALEEEQQLRALVEKQYNEIAEEDTDSPYSMSTAGNSPVQSLGHFAGKKAVKTLFKEGQVATPGSIKVN